MNPDPCRFRKISKLKPRPKKKLAQPGHPSITYSTRASRSTCTPRKHYCEMTDNTNASYPARACASKGLCDRSWRLYIVVYCILYISLHFFLEPIFYLPKYSLSEVYFNRDRLLIEFNGLWYSLAARQVFAAIANPDSLSFG